jgi:hypothetical protein
MTDIDIDEQPGRLDASEIGREDTVDTVAGSTVEVTREQLPCLDIDRRTAQAVVQCRRIVDVHSDNAVDADTLQHRR